jgi:LysR family transcriptional regulator, low CO2-responsive transcriptional regulator
MASIRNITIRQLRALSETVRTGTLTAAAKMLGVTPPAITLQLQQLESQIGLPLLQRKSEGTVPTDAGQELLVLAERIENALTDCDSALDAMKGLSGGKVCVGVVSTAKYFAPFALSEFAKTHPSIEMRLVIGNRQEVIDGLESFEIDVAIMGRPPAGMAVEQALIGDHPHVIIAPIGHPMIGRHCTLAELSAETFLLREQGSGTRLLTEFFFEQIGKTPRIGMEIGSNETIKQAVMAGLGIALISVHTIAAEIADRRLAILDVEGLPVRRQWFLIRRKEKRMLPALSALHDFLASETGRFLPRIPGVT